MQGFDKVRPHLYAAVMLREPAVAGSFYPSDANKLSALLSQFLTPVTHAKSATAIMVPHAGYIYSGKFAGEVYSRVKIPDSVVILSPNHTGAGKRISVDTDEEWQTPFGKVSVDTDLAEKILTHCFGAVSDKVAHRQEHAIEVHLPFLQKLNPKAQIVPIVLGPLNRDACHILGSGLAKAIQESKKEVLIIASTDMSHYISSQEAEKVDKLALHCIEKLDPAALYQTVVDYDISMCGFIPTTVTLEAARILGATQSEVVAYGNSGEASGNFRRVVAYASAIIY